MLQQQEHNQHGSAGIKPCNRTNGDDNPFLSLACNTPKHRQILPCDTELDRFQIKKHLGSGSIAEVYLAFDKLRDQDVAIKVMETGNSDSTCPAEQLKSEIAAYERIKDFHHVLKVYDLQTIAFGATELLVLSMEYADGGTFRKWLTDNQNNGQIRKTQGIEYFKQACLGLKAVHEVGTVHLDVKPENILFVNGVAKIADFSISALQESHTISRDLNYQSDFFESEKGFGTPKYMSPDHFMCSYRDELDASADIYSLCIMLYEIHHPKGRTPFSGGYRRLRDLHINVRPPSLLQVDENLRRVIDRG